MMDINGNYDEMIENHLKEELTWLEEELDLIFKQKKLKGSYTKYDISVGTKILDNVIENIKTSENAEVLNLLAITLNKIELTYPEISILTKDF